MKDETHDESTESVDTQKEVGRRETLKLATLATALGAGLSVAFRHDLANAQGAKDGASGGSQLQIKIYQQRKDGTVLAHTALVPEDVAKLLVTDQLVQVKWFVGEPAEKEHVLVGESAAVQIKVALTAKGSLPSAKEAQLQFKTGKGVIQQKDPGQIQKKF